MIHGLRQPKLFAHYDGRRFSPGMIDKYWQSGGMPWVHLFVPAFTYNYFYAYHPDFKVIMIIRDLRDAYVSYAHWICDPDIPEEEKIYRSFENGAYFEMSSCLSIFLNEPRFYIIRFEDLIGPMGGGDKDKQTETIHSLAAYIGMPISKSLARSTVRDFLEILKAPLEKDKLARGKKHLMKSKNSGLKTILGRS